MRRRYLLSAGVLAGILVVGALLVSSGGAQAPGLREIKLVEGEGAFRFVDNPPKSRVRSRRAGPSTSVGDSFAFNAPLTDPQSNAGLGRLDVSCVVTDGGRRFGDGTAQCEGTYSLRDGAISIQAALAGEPRTVTFAITGGTAAYEGARGSGTSTSRPRSDLSDTTLRLLP